MSKQTLELSVVCVEALAATRSLDIGLFDATSPGVNQVTKGRTPG
jgi:hypothetical protein